MRSATPRSLNVPSSSAMSISPRISASMAAIVARRSASQRANQCAMRRKRGHQNARASGKSFQRGEMRLAERDELAHRIGRELLGVALGEIADGGVDDGAALGGAGRGIDRIERPQAQNVLGVDRIGIAQPMFDLGDRKAFRPRRARRRRRRLRRRHDPLRPVELARPGQIVLAALHGSFPAFAGNGGEALDEARRHRRRAGDFCRMAQRHVARAQELREIVGGQADAALRQIEAEREPHRAA